MAHNVKMDVLFMDALKCFKVKIKNLCFETSLMLQFHNMNISIIKIVLRNYSRIYIVCNNYADKTNNMKVIMFYLTYITLIIEIMKVIPAKN